MFTYKKHTTSEVVSLNGVRIGRIDPTYDNGYCWVDVCGTRSQRFETRPQLINWMKHTFA